MRVLLGTTNPSKVKIFSDFLKGYVIEFIKLSILFYPPILYCLFLISEYKYFLFRHFLLSCHHIFVIRTVF